MSRAADGGAVVRRAALPAFAILLAAACAEGSGDARRGADGDAVQVWVTTGDRTKLLAREPDLTFGSTAMAPDTVRVDAGVRYQEMVGFGAALTDASAWLIHTQLPPARQDSLLTELFSARDGIGLGFTRIPMGASDFARSHYSYDDVPAGERDPELRRFSIAPDSADVLPLLRRMREIQPELAIMATPWSPPGWMKTTDRLIGGRLRDDAYDALARYFLAFLEAYAGAGVPIFAISVQNEPHFEPADYPGMRMEPAERARFIGRHLGPLLARSAFHPLVLEWDHNWDQPESPLATLADSAARAYIDGVAWHCYGGEVSAQARVHEAYPSEDAFFTECSGGDWAPDFADNLLWTLRVLIIETTRAWSRGTLLWNLALDPAHGPHAGGCGDCRGVVTIDPATGTWTRNEEYWALAHASRFVRRGAHRIASTGVEGGVENVAFENPDGSRVLIAVNEAAEVRDFLVQTGDRSFAASLPPRAVATLRWR